jgi:hypothetical protein
MVGLVIAGMQFMSIYNSNQSNEYKRIKMEAKKKKAERAAEELRLRALNEKK